ncbi:unnamed protein product [Alopecurus aequalis]
MAAADRLSALPDDVLKRVLSFAPARDAAASAILSCRWRSLWRQASAVILDSRPYGQAERELCGYYSPTFSAFFRDAHAALAAFRRRRRGTGLKRLTLFLEEGTYQLSERWYNNAEPDPAKDRRVADLLDDPSVARLEGLSISCEDSYYRRYAPPLDSLPCAATLRVLELTRCSHEQPSPGGLSFPHLKDLTLEDCYFLEGYLQVIIDAAPALARLALTNVHQRAPEPAGSTKKDFYNSDYYSLPLRLVCPTVTALVLRTYASKEELEASSNGGSGIELDMPSLRFFRYRGYPIKLSLTSPTQGFARVDLDVTPRPQHGWGVRSYEPPSRMLANFSSTRALKLRLINIEDLVEHGGDVMLTAFPNLEILELDGKYQYMNSNTAVAMATLLRSCPAMSELRLRLNMQWNYYHDRKYENHVGGPFAESMDRFESLASMSSARRAAVQIGGVSELPDALANDCAFSCLQKSLRKVTLGFKAKEVNCFEVQLAKFLVENAMVLEEMHVDDGSRFWPDHLFHKVARWRADAFQKRNLPDTVGFAVYQLAEDAVDSEKEQPFYG